MAARLTDKQKKKIVADYLESGSYNATAKMNNVCDGTVKRIVEQSGDIQEKLEEKKAQNTADILEYMESRKGLICEIIQKGLEVLNKPGKLDDATPAQISTMIGTLLDKAAQYTNNGTISPDMAEDNRILAQMFKRGDSNAE